MVKAMSIMKESDILKDIEELVLSTLMCDCDEWVCVDQLALKYEMSFSHMASLVESSPLLTLENDIERNAIDWAGYIPTCDTCNGYGHMYACEGVWFLCWDCFPEEYIDDDIDEIDSVCTH